MSVPVKKFLYLTLFVVGVAGALVFISFVFYMPLSLFGLYTVLLGVSVSALLMLVADIWRTKLVTSSRTESFEFHKEIGKLFPPDEERLEAIRRTQEIVRPLEGFDVGEKVEDAINLYWIYNFLLENITDNVHGGKVDLSESKEIDLLNARVTHLKNCPKCQKLLGYVTNEMQKLLPVENEEVEA